MKYEDKFLKKLKRYSLTLIAFSILQVIALGSAIIFVSIFPLVSFSFINNLFLLLYLYNLEDVMNSIKFIFMDDN